MQNSLTNMLPVNFVSAGVHRLVELIDADVLDFAPGFFHQAMQNISSRETAVRIMPLDEWQQAEQALSGNRDFQNITFIFHVGRCGSTLLGQNLKENGQCLVLGEPAFLGSSFLDSTFGALANQMRLQIVQAWQRWASSRGERLVIKMSSKECSNIAAFKKLWPNATFVGLTRDPLPVIESQSRNPSRFLQSQLDAVEGSTKTIVTVAAQEYRAAMDHMGRVLPDGLIHIDYDELPDRFTHLLTLLRIESIKKSIEWDAQFQAKNPNPTKRKYHPTSPTILAEFYATHAELVDSLRAAYRDVIGVTA